MPQSIRLAEIRDIPVMIGLLAELFSIEADFHPDPDRQMAGLRSLLQTPAAKAWVAEKEGRVVGMITLQIVISTAEGGSAGLIEDLVVAQAWRGQGVGRELLAAAERWARQNGLRRLQLLADCDNRPALDFYRRMGWRSTRLVALRKTDFGVDCL
jgi:GNAT superfamily N-acetyltransferase